MPKSKEANKQIRREKREAILNSAISVFAKKGYFATNIEDISQNADISVGLIYRYFSSKEALYSEIVDFAIKGLEEITELLNSSQNPKETIKSIASMMLYELDNVEFINLNLMVLQSTIMAFSPRYDEILSSDRLMFEACAKLIEKGQEQGVFSKGDAMAKSIYFFSSIMGMTITRALYKSDFPAPVVNDIIAFLINSEGDK